MRINHNIASMATQSSLFKVNRDMSKSLQKLSTGLRINSAADDAAGLGVSENLRTQIRGGNQALRNTQDSIALLQIADGALSEQADILQRMRELVIQAKNDTYTSTERHYMGTEFSSLTQELDRIASTTRYNGMQLFATPEQSGNYTPDGSAEYASNLESATPETAHKTMMAGALQDNPLGPNDMGSGNHFNMNIGGNYSANDAASYISAGNDDYFSSSSENMITIQFGQMDTNTLLYLDPTNAFAGSDPIFNLDGSTLFSDFTFDADPTTQSFGDFMIQAANPNATVQDKLGLLLKIIDGRGDQLTPAEVSVFNTAQSGSPTGLDRVNKMRAYIGAMENRLEHTVNNLMNQVTNTQSAESLIRDVDFASETANMTRAQIITQSATAFLSQANSAPQSVLQLLNR